jgi:hypothetical protein
MIKNESFDNDKADSADFGRAILVVVFREIIVGEHSQHGHLERSNGFDAGDLSPTG